MASTTTARKSVPAVTAAKEAPDAVVAPSKPTRVKVERGMADVTRVAKLLGVKVQSTEFPGLGKAVKTDTGAIYVNAGYADVRGSKDQVAAWVKASKGVERSATYVRVAL